MAQQVTISKIEIQNYRSCFMASFGPNKTLSVLIGLNASGKSNLLHALLLIKKLYEFDLYEEERERFAHISRFKVWFCIGGKTVRYTANISYGTDERNNDRILHTSEKWNFKDFTGKNRWEELPLSLLGSSAKRYYRFDEYRYYLNMKKFRKVIHILKFVSEFANSIKYYSAAQFTDPSRCPASFEIDEGSVRRSLRTHDHQRFIYDLYLSYKKSRKDYKEFISLVGKSGLNLIEGIRFSEVNVPSRVVEVKTGGKVIRRTRETIVVIPSFLVGQSKLSPNQLSEGTFKTIALLFYLITDKSRLLLIEEPEVCVHHGLLMSIIELIKQFSKKKQIVISTHSDFVLDMLEPDQVYLVQNSPRSGTTVRNVPKLLSASNYRALKDYLATSGNLGEYWRHGGFGQ